MSLKHDLWRVKQERDAARAALAASAAALAVTRDDLIGLIAGGRLADIGTVWATGIAAAVIRPDGGVDVTELDRRITTLLAEHPEQAVGDVRGAI